MDAAPPPESNARKYRSKKHRPCDLCRTRKIQCKLQRDESACALCQKMGRQCTYVMGPLRRKTRPPIESHNVIPPLPSMRQSQGEMDLSAELPQHADAPAKGREWGTTTPTRPCDNILSGMPWEPSWLEQIDEGRHLLPSRGTLDTLIDWSNLDPLPGPLLAW